MATIHFISNETIITADWANDVDNLVYDIFDTVLFLNPAGSFGIGELPPSIISTAKVLQVASQTALLDYFGSHLWHNTYLDVFGLPRYKEAGAATAITLGTDITFKTSVTGSAGNVVTFIDRLRITNNEGLVKALTGFWVAQGTYLKADDVTFNIPYNILGVNASDEIELGGIEGGACPFNTLKLYANAAIRLQLDDTSTAGETAMLLYDVDNATLERVTVGVADSGGAGYKVLRIPN